MYNTFLFKRKFHCISTGAKISRFPIKIEHNSGQTKKRQMKLTKTE